jgi:hypothetical protein
MGKLKTLDELIKFLQEQRETHGNLPLYSEDDSLISEGYYPIGARKVYTNNGDIAFRIKGFLREGSLDTENEKLYDIDLSKGVVRGFIV